MPFIYQEITMGEREQMLVKMAKKTETRSYSRSLQESEIEAEQKRLATDLLEIKELELQLQNIKSDYKQRMENINTRVDERLEKIKTGTMQISGTLYGIPNFKNGRMLFYDKFGELIDSRTLLPDELQGKLYSQDDGGAFSELPVETQAVINQKLQENGSAGVEAQAQAIIDGQTGEKSTIHTEGGNVITVDPKPEFTHDEDGWEVMTDEQLVEKYGTTDISVIRTMVLHEGGVWKVPTEPEAPKAKGRGKKNN